MSNHWKLNTQEIESSKTENKTLLNRDTQVNQLIILTEQKQKHVIIIKNRTKISIVHSMFPIKKERGQRKRKKFSLQTLCLGSIKPKKNREPGNERVNRPVTRIVISRRKALEKRQNKTKTCKQTLGARCLRTTKRINKIKKGERMWKVTRKMERNSFCFKFAFWFGLRTVFKRR